MQKKHINSAFHNFKIKCTQNKTEHSISTV